MSYTDEMYANMAVQANETGKQLYVVNGELEINEPGYYLCTGSTNETDGTLNPDFGKISTEEQIAQIKQQLLVLDQKRIRAVCEPEFKDEEEGVTWLEYYNFKVLELRSQLAELQ